MASPIPDGAAPPPFPGYSAAGFDFLRQLHDHNDRDWFNARKSVYVDEVRDPTRLLVADVSRALNEAGSSFTTGKAMRIYRDVRFSKDKSPYRTSLGVTFSREAVDDPAFVYVHVEPSGSFVAAGLYRATAKILRPLRELAARDPDAFWTMAQEVEASGMEFGSLGHELSSMPRGFAAHKDGPVADVLRWESWVAQASLSDAEVQSPNLVGAIVAVERAARPLVDYVDAARE